MLALESNRVCPEERRLLITGARQHVIQRRDMASMQRGDRIHPKRQRDSDGADRSLYSRSALSLYHFQLLKNPCNLTL